MSVRNIIAAIALALMAAAPASAQNNPIRDTYHLIAERLSLMTEVAAWKRANEVPVEDLPREKIVLESARIDAAALGLDPGSVGPFIQEQMDSAKEVQNCLIKRWDAAQKKADELAEIESEWGERKPQGLAPEVAEDALEKVRPRLVALNASLMSTIKATLATGATYGDAEDLKAFDEIVAVDCLSRGRRAGIYKALRLVKEAE